MVQQTKTFGQEWGWLITSVLTLAMFTLSTYRLNNSDVAEKIDKLDAKVSKSIEKLTDDNNQDHTDFWRAISSVNVRTIKLETKHGIDSKGDLSYNNK
jgi:hypothetical protein